MVTGAVSTNSISARLFKYLRNPPAFYGRLNFHCWMKTKNWSKFTMFQRYLSPYESAMFKTMFPLVTTVIDFDATLSSTLI